MKRSWASERLAKSLHCGSNAAKTPFGVFGILRYQMAPHSSLLTLSTRPWKMVTPCVPTESKLYERPAGGSTGMIWKDGVAAMGAKPGVCIYEAKEKKPESHSYSLQTYSQRS